MQGVPGDKALTGGARTCAALPTAPGPRDRSRRTPWGSESPHSPGPVRSSDIRRSSPAVVSPSPPPPPPIHPDTNTPLTLCQQRLQQAHDIGQRGRVPRQLGQHAQQAQRGESPPDPTCGSVCLFVWWWGGEEEGRLRVGKSAGTAALARGGRRRQRGAACGLRTLGKRSSTPTWSAAALNHPTPHPPPHTHPSRIPPPTAALLLPVPGSTTPPAAHWRVRPQPARRRPPAVRAVPGAAAVPAPPAARPLQRQSRPCPPAVAAGRRRWRLRGAGETLQRPPPTARPACGGARAGKGRMLWPAAAIGVGAPAGWQLGWAGRE